MPRAYLSLGCRIASEALMEPERNIAAVLDDLTAAGTRDACVLAAARAASELAGASGLCLLSATGDESLVALASRQQLCLCDLQDSGLYRTAVALHRVGGSGAATLWDAEESLRLPNGRSRRINLALIVPIRAEGHPAVGFFWQQRAQADDPLRARQLELLAKALDLASRGWRKDEEQAARLRIAAELQHQWRNNLALVRSIVRRSQETADSAEHFALHLEGRIGALTRIQGALVAAGGNGVDLEQLIHAELLASAAGSGCIVQGPSVRVHGKSAELLGLAVHELATNSLKFGALASPTARLAIKWNVTGEPAPDLRLSWTETRVTIASAAPRRRGFGHELIECTLPYEFGAHCSVTFRPGRVACAIQIPLAACAAPAEPARFGAAHGASAW